MTLLLALPQNRLLFELLSEEMNTAYNIHAGTRINQYTWSLQEMRKISGLSRRKFRLAFTFLRQKNYLIELYRSENTPSGVIHAVSYSFNEELQDQIMTDWQLLLHEYWRLRHHTIEY